MKNNELFIKALRIKTTKEPSARELAIMEQVRAFGFDFDNTDWSQQDYYELVNIKTNKRLVISLDRAGNSGVFNPYSLIVPIKRLPFFDIEGYLNKPLNKGFESRWVPDGLKRTPKIQAYLKNKEAIRNEMTFIKCREQDICNMEKQVQALQAKIAQSHQSISASQKKIMELRQQSYSI